MAEQRSNYRRELAFTDIMSDAFDYFRAYAVRALCKARLMPRGKMKHLQLVCREEQILRANYHAPQARRGRPRRP